MPEPIKVIITKYALTSGPILATGIQCQTIPIERTIKIERKNDVGFVRTDFYHRQDWQTTKEDAIANVRERAAQKKLSLEKQIAKVEKQLSKALATIEAMDLTTVEVSK